MTNGDISGPFKDPLSVIEIVEVAKDKSMIKKEKELADLKEQMMEMTKERDSLIAALHMMQVKLVYFRSFLDILNPNKLQ